MKEQTVKDILNDNPELKTAINEISEKIESDGSVEWDDINEEITSGQWGRLIESGVLEKTDEGEYVFSDEDTIRSVVEDSPTVIPDSNGSGWTKYDKLAAGGVGLLVLGYSVNPIRNIIAGALDLFLGPIDAILPFHLVLIIIALFTAVYSTIIQAKLMETEKAQKIQERMKEIQQKQKEARDEGNDRKLNELQSEQMDAVGDQIKLMKIQFRPSVWIALLTIPMFLWIYWTIQTGQLPPTETSIVLPLIGETNWLQSAFGPLQAWILWYVLASFALNQVIRKVFNVEIMP